MLLLDRKIGELVSIDDGAITLTVQSHDNGEAQLRIKHGTIDYSVSLKKNEEISIRHDILVRFVRWKNSFGVRLGITAPISVHVSKKRGS